MGSIMDQIPPTEEMLKNSFTISTDGEHPNFLVKIKDGDLQATVTFNVFEVGSWDMDGKISTVEPYLEAMIKWDGCSHVYFGGLNEDGARDSYLHLCGINDFKKHVSLLKQLYNKAFEIMKATPMDGEGKWE